MFGIDSKALKGGFATTIAINIMRGLLNGSLKGVTPKDLVVAIDADTSLWGVAGNDIASQAQSFPIGNLTLISDIREIVDSQYGGFPTLCLAWLSTDHPVLYNVIVNTPNNRGTIWLEKQINEILDGVQNGRK